MSAHIKIPQRAGLFGLPGLPGLYGLTRLAGCVLTALFCAWFLAQTTFFLLAEPRLPLPGTTPAERGSEERGAQSAFTTAAIMTRNLFGAQLSPVADTQKTVPDDNKGKNADTNGYRGSLDDLDALPLSARGWKLLGTIVAPDPAASRAVIATGSGQKSYGEGDSIDDSIVELIRRKLVVLRKGGQRERLAIDTGPAATTLPSPVQSAAPAQRTEQTRRLANDPVALMRDISLKPRSLGAVQGMEITTLKTGSPLHELGLRTGDIVLSVNDMPVRSFDDLAKLTAFIASQTLRVKLMRNGTELELE